MIVGIDVEDELLQFKMHCKIQMCEGLNNKSKECYRFINTDVEIF